jgi:GNAT superfamily N-acetyltransferase
MIGSSLRPAVTGDFAFCRRLYFEDMAWIIDTLKLDMAKQRKNFSVQWRLAEVRIITVAAENVGWLQTASTEDSLFLEQLYLTARTQRQGIGSDVVRALIEEATRARRAINLGVVKISPARRLYERLGFQLTHGDEHKFYMRRDFRPREQQG